MFTFVLGLALVGLAGTSPMDRNNADVGIVGGEDMDIKNAPYQVSVQLKGSHICGGSIINEDTVITAAHCLQYDGLPYFTVRVGSNFSWKGGLVVPIRDMTAHPKYNVPFLDNDVGILRLSEPLTFNDAVKPVEMVSFGEEILDGEATLVTGWGDTSYGGIPPRVLQGVELFKINDDTCKNDVMYQKYVTERMLCAGLPEGGKSACHGDSGGPLVSKNGKLAGIVSWSAGCASPGFPTVFAKVSALRDWIDANIV